MTTNNDARSEFLRAIRNTVLVRDSDTQPIIESEHSGKRAAWLFDFRALMLQPKWLDYYADLFWDTYADRLPFQVGAMETAGIGLVAAIVMKSAQRGTPINGFFIRKSRKRQGLMKQIEGTLTDEPIVLVDDLINRGGTFQKQMLILREQGKTVRDLCAIIAFREQHAYAEFEASGAHLTTFFTIADLGLPLLKEEPPVPTRELRWRFAAPNPSFHLVVHKSTPALDGQRVFFGTDAGIFYALNKTTGDVLWEFRIGTHPKGKGILSSPAAHDDTVYFGAYDGTIYALETATGAVRWKYEEADWVGSSPTLASKRHTLFVGLEFGLFKKHGGIAALDMHTGKRRWIAHTSSLTHGSPLYIEGESLVVIGSNDGILYAYDAASGIEKWRAPTQGEIKMAPVYDARRRLVLTTSMDGTLYALNAGSGIPVFAFATGAGIYGAPCIDDERVYIAALDKYVYAINLATGNEVWRFATGGRIFASPAIANGSLWIGSNDGALYELDPRSGKRRSIFQASERILTKIACDERAQALYFGTVANELYCLDIKRRPVT